MREIRGSRRGDGGGRARARRRGRDSAGAARGAAAESDSASRRAAKYGTEAGPESDAAYGATYGAAPGAAAPAPSPTASAVRRYAPWFPVVLIVAGIVMDLSVPPGYTPSAVFAAAPLVAAPLLSARATVLSAVAALLALVGLLVFVGAPAWSESVMLVTTVAVVAVLALGINYLVRRSYRQLASARDIAEAAQLAVLPVPPGRIGVLEVAARYEAAQAGARIGGDFYAVQETPFGIRMIVGDVRGKGLGSVEAVAVVLGAFREAAEAETTLEDIAWRLEHALQRESTRRRGLDLFEGFTTAALAEVPVTRPDRLVLVNRGHPAPLLCADGAARYLEPTVPALPLGLGELGEWPDRADECPFPVGAQLLLYTDGLSESRDGRGRFYDPADRITGRAFHGPQALLDAVVTDVTRHTGGRATDDMALLAVGRPAHPGEDGPAER